MPTLLHTADWHLGKSLNGKFDLHDEQAFVVEHLLALIVERDPDVVVIAGDLFDNPERQSVAALKLWTHASEAIVRGRSAGRPLVVIPGNHDHAYRVGLNTGLASSLHVVHDLSLAEVPLQLAGLAITAIPFHKPARVRALAERYGDTSDIGDFDDHAAMAYLTRRALAQGDGRHPRVAVAHAFLVGGDPEGTGEEPIAAVGGVGGVRATAFEGFDYVALGHLHRAFAVAGAPHVRYSGSLYPYSFDEENRKSATLLTWPDGATAGTPPVVELLPLRQQRWVRVVEGVTFETLLAGASEPGARRDDYILASVSDRQPIPHAQARLREAYPNAQFEQRLLDVASAQRLDVPDPNEHSVAAMFEAFYRSSFGDEPLSDLERELLREALARTAAEREA
jgi:DNA repair protein SbcD/Mre11